ncbi:oligosaccharide flippase family protein [Micromonospora sp. NPDC049903]|uniref:oligosaccharide flippase family protein n=1 Tax=Micromonospora sp. NPDC049903 TaxID=3364276 RepID=UPI0037888ACA
MTIRATPRPAPAATGSGGRRAFARRAVAALSVNGLSSVGNLMVSISVARGESLSGLGQFALAFSVYVLVIGLVRTAVTEAVLAARQAPERRAVGRGARRAAAVAVVSGVLTAATGAVLGSPYLTVVGLALPGLVVYDYVKAISIGVGGTRVAWTQECAWLCCTALSVGTVLGTGAPTVMIFAGWAASGAVLGVVAALWQRYGVLPGWGLDRRETRVAASFAAQFLVTTGSAQLALSALAATAGVAVVGALGAARTVFGPVTLLTTTLSSLIVPYLAQSRADTPRARVRAAGAVVALSVGVLLPLVLALCLLPDEVGRTVLGDNWHAARPLLPLLSVEALLAPIALVAFAGHRVQSAGARALAIGVALGPLRIATIVAGGVLFGAGGAAGALAVLALLSAACWWFSYLRLDATPVDSR